MAERTRGDAQRDRTSARERRRSLASKPFEALDEAAGGENGNGGAAAAAKHAARTAAAAAIAGGLAGAAKALVQRRAHDDDGADDEPDETPQRAESTDEEPRDEQEAEAPEEQSGEEDEDEPDGGEGDEDEAPSAPAASDDAPSKGGSMSEARDVVDRARGHVEALLGKEADSVSGISRRNGSWAVDLEVVEVHRVPDSTDVLSTYEVVLDDDGGLLSLERRGRYRRSQVEEGR